MHKRTENITTSKEVVKCTDEVHKRTEKITTSEEVHKGSDKLEDMKEAVVKICRKDSDNFEGRSKGYIGWFNIDHKFFLIKCSTLEPDFYKTLQKDIEGLDMEPY